MIYDHRTYTCHPGRIGKHMKLYEEYGWEAQRRHLGEPIVYGAVETGDVNSYVHIWVYKDAADRAAKRAAMGRRSRMAELPQAQRGKRQPGTAGEHHPEAGPVLRAVGQGLTRPS